MRAQQQQMAPEVDNRSASSAMRLPDKTGGFPGKCWHALMHVLAPRQYVAYLLFDCQQSSAGELQ